MAAPAIELIGISKSFGGVAANADVRLSAARGTIHAIVGENGAGKSTAMKILYGVHAADSGEIRVDGKPWGGRGRKWKSPSDAIACGIGMVHQHFMLAGPYSALENVLLGAEAPRGAWRGLPRALRPLDRKGGRARLEELSRRYGMPVDWDAPVESLPVGVQQRIEILKLLYRDASVLILDEPTAVLTPQETAGFFDNLRKLAAEGKTVLIITHKLKEVMSLASRVTVMRAGRVTGEVAVSETSPDKLAGMMVGRDVVLQVAAPAAPSLGAPALELSEVSLEAEGRGARRLLSDLSFEVRAGEIVGVAGVEGNGQSELLRLLRNPRAFAGRVSGSIRVLGRDSCSGPARSWPTAAAIRARGVGIVPEDRHREALLLERPMRENYLLGLQRRPFFSRFGLLSDAAVDREVARVFEEYDVRPRAPGLAAGRFSGGNQQKVVFARETRELERGPGLLVAAQPTRGVDVGAIELIHRRVFRARDEGAGVLVVSSELDEILTLSDRILVFYEGRIVARYARGEADERKLGLAMGGGRG